MAEGVREELMPGEQIQVCIIPCHPPLVGPHAEVTHGLSHFVTCVGSQTP